MGLGQPAGPAIRPARSVPTGQTPAARSGLQSTRPGPQVMGTGQTAQRLLLTRLESKMSALKSDQVGMGRFSICLNGGNTSTYEGDSLMRAGCGKYYVVWSIQVLGIGHYLYRPAPPPPHKQNDVITTMLAA